LHYICTFKIKKMKYFKYLFAALTISFVLFSCAKIEPEEPVEPTPVQKDTLSALELKISKMMLVGVAGCGPELTGDMKKMVQDLKVGGIILFEKWGTEVRNVESRSQVTALSANLRNAADYDLIIAIDQEGGKVCRLKTQYGYPATVQAQYIGTLNNPDTTDFYAEVIANMVASSNITMNCAPVVDVNVNPSSPAIGALGRSFSSDPEVVANIAEVFYDKQKAHKVISVYKHFPGHGSAVTDTHNGFTDVTNTWSEQELIPYKRLIAAGKCDAIMSAHVFNKNLDATYPATLSYNTMTKLLRQEMKYSGVIMTDDMSMGAITEKWTTDEAVELAINAGVDMFIFSRADPVTLRKTIATIAKLVEAGKIPQSRIDESYTRITKLAAKMK